MALVNHYKKILIHAPNWLGDHILAFPFYKILRNVFSDPDVRIDLIGKKMIIDIVPTHIFNSVYYIDHNPLYQAFKMSSKKKQYDLGITLSPSFRSALLLFVMKAKIRLGYNSDFRRICLKPLKNSKIVLYNNEQHRSLNYVSLLKGWRSKNELFMLWKKYQYEKTILPAITKKNHKQKLPYIVMCLGSMAPSRKYPLESFQQVIIAILTKYVQLNIFFVGTSLEKNDTQHVLNTIIQTKKTFQKRLFNKVEATNLIELYSLIVDAKLLIANDSGVAHLSHLTQTPLITFFGAGKLLETQPLNKNLYIHSVSLPCLGCLKNICPRKNNQLECLNRIHVNDVVTSIQYFNLRLG